MIEILEVSKTIEAKQILKAIGMPQAQQNDMAALTLLALANIREHDSWSDATKPSLGVVKGIMNFIRNEYNRDYKENTRETVRRNVLHQFCQGSIAVYNPDLPNLPVNSPRAHYALTDQCLKVLRSFGTEHFVSEVNTFLSFDGGLDGRYSKEREIQKIPLKINNDHELYLSPGDHNVLQVAIVEEFGARFAKGGELLYLGDTENKHLYFLEDKLKSLNVNIQKHSKLPDVIIYQKESQWLFLIEAVTSHGPMSPKRLIELNELFKDCKAGLVFVTAFLNLKDFKSHATNIAWDTEVWLRDVPDHMIHFNGDRFMGPR